MSSHSPGDHESLPSISVTGRSLPFSQGMGEVPPLDQLMPAFQKLVETIARLRSPGGCPWDREQTLETIKKHTLEETYELLEAIDSKDDSLIVEELGDVLLQVVLDAQIGRDEQRFDLLDVMNGLTAKMIHRHPHVFGDAVAHSAGDVKTHWEAAKQKEKQRESRLDGIPVDLPALARAARLSEKAARAGYDFPQREMLFDKLREELVELQEELYPAGIPVFPPASVDGPVIPDEPIPDAARKARVESELGDLLFVISNIARRWNIHPEEALKVSNRKFEKRFRAIEQAVQSEGKTLAETSLQEMEEIYQRVKQQEKRDARS